MYDDLFEFLEADLAGIGTLLDEDATALDPLLLANELLNAEWTDDEAAHEIARHASCEEIRQAQASVLSGLLLCPFVDPFSIRLSRILWRALDELERH